MIEQLTKVFSRFGSDGDWLMSIFEPVAQPMILRQLRSDEEIHVEELSPQSLIEYASDGRVAVIDVSGVMYKRSTSVLRTAVANAAADTNVKAILLHVDSPGGSVSGLVELADAIASAAKSKIVWAYNSELMASAAYFTSSQAQKIFTSKSSLTGSIGTRLFILDASQLFSNIGLKAIPIDTGKYKSAGALGTELTEEQKSYFQSIVDSFQAEFTSAVQRGRSFGPDQLAAVSDGRVFPAAEAMQLGLVDGVQTFEHTLSQLTALVADKQSPKGKKAMSENTTGAIENTAASFEQLETCLIGASSDFIVACQKQKLTLDQAVAAHLKGQADKVAALDKAEADRKAALEVVGSGGVNPQQVVEGGGKKADNEPAGDGKAFFADYQARVKAGKSKLDAFSQARKDDPDGYDSWMTDYNATHETTEQSRGRLTKRSK